MLTISIENVANANLKKLTGWLLLAQLGYYVHMAVRVVEFSSGGTKLEIFLHKNQHTQMKLLNFENCVNGEVVKKC